MEINELSATNYADLFSTNPAASPAGPVAATPLERQDLFGGEKAPENPAQTPEEPVNADLFSGDEDGEEENVEAGREGEAPVEGEKPKTGRKAKYDFSDAKGYFEDRIKSGRFVSLEEEVNGEVRQFVPSTPEEFDEFFDIQLSHIEQKSKDEIAQKWYEEKTPAWKAVAKYAEMVDDPSEIVPFIQGVSNIQSVADLNENEETGAEQIIRLRLQQRGDTKDVIDEHVEALRSADKLVSTATKYKPLILQQEQAQLQQMMKEKEEQEQQYLSLVSTIRDEAFKALETPFYGKKLKQEEKRDIFNLIGQPSAESGGYEIYTKIDKLFEKKDFNKLLKIAMMLEHEEAYNQYASTATANKVAENLQRQLRVAGDGKTIVGKTPLQDEKPKAPVQRRVYTGEGIRIGGGR